MENDIFWSAIGSGFGEPDGTPPPGIPRRNPPPPPRGNGLNIFFRFPLVQISKGYDTYVDEGGRGKAKKLANIAIYRLFDGDRFLPEV